MEGCQWAGGGGKWGEVQGIRSINGRYKIDRVRLRIIEQPWLVWLSGLSAGP